MTTKTVHMGWHRLNTSTISSCLLCAINNIDHIIYIFWFLKFIKFIYTPWYSWNTAKVGVKHQLTNRACTVIDHLMKIDQHTTNIVSHWSNKRLIHMRNRGIIHWCYKGAFNKNAFFFSFWNTAKVGVKHQLTNRACTVIDHLMKIDRTIIHLFSVSDSYVSCDIVRRYLFSLRFYYCLITYDKKWRRHMDFY
jgi:hypothetical protein